MSHNPAPQTSTKTSGPRQRTAPRFTRRRRRKAAEAAVAYAFLTPWILGMILLTAGPMLYSLYLSFTRYNLLTDPQWVGFANFVQMFTTDPRFFKSVAVTLAYVLISVPLLLILSMLLALLLNTSMRFLTGYRALFYLPSLMGVSVAIAALWRVIFGANGLVNKILAAFGIQHASWVGDPHTALSTIILLALVVFGTTMIIFLAGLRQVPREHDLRDIATMDWPAFRPHLELPLYSDEDPVPVGVTDRGYPVPVAGSLRFKSAAQVHVMTDK